MKPDKYQDKYDEIFKELKDEKMDWSFSEFIEKTAKIPVLAVRTNKKIGLWCISIAACAIILIGIGVFMNRQTPADKPQTLAKTAVKNVQAKTLPVVKIIANGAKQPNRSLANTIDNEPLQSARNDEHTNNLSVEEKQVLPNDTATTTYAPNYVIVNGRQIVSEKEAIAQTEQAVKTVSSKLDIALAPLKTMR